MYLYLLQQGKDIYTGKPISLDELFDNNLYDIDHIYPQSLTKDDNLDNNMVLTEKTVNNHKQDKYPLEEGIRKKCTPLWRDLHQKGFINDEKYKRLTGVSELTDEQKAGFIARQLVETSQGTKAVAEILKHAFREDTTVVYSKAKVVSDFRQKYALLKSRTVNDLHHAQDAYLNIVVGNSYFVKFTNNPMKFIKERYNKDKSRYSYNLARFFERDVENGSETAWIGSGKSTDGTENEKGTITAVKRMLSKNTPLMTRMNYVGRGALSDQTIVKAEETGEEIRYIPLKGSDPRYKVSKYGGYAKTRAAYFALVESGEEKGRIRTIEPVPVYLAEHIEKDPDCLENYCRNQLKLKNPSVRLRKIKIKSELKYNGYYLYVTAKTNDRLSVANAMNLFMDLKDVDYIKKIEKMEAEKVIDKNITKEENERLYRKIVDKHEKTALANRPGTKKISIELSENFDKFEKLSIKDQAKVLLQLLKLTAVGTNGKADLVSIGLRKQSGAMTINQRITGAKECKLINRSVTGIYENAIDLLTV